ncbi:MAG: hypothetical protein K8963_00340 [Proteobacteria bacterium]|nr:hypothetical protein [Pseudomonadota bacterium]
MPSFTLKGGTLFADGNQVQTDLHLDGRGHLIAAGDKPDGFCADEVIDVSRKWLVVNLSDIGARMTVPRRELAESLPVELQAAHAGGVSQVMMRPHLNHYVDHSDHVRQLHRICADFKTRASVCASLYRHNPEGGDGEPSTPQRFIDFHSMFEAGCRDIDVPPRTHCTLRDIEKAMTVAESLDMRLYLTPLEPHLAGTGCCHQGELSARLGLDGIGIIAETVSMLAHLEIAASTGARLHLSQLTSARAVEILARARQDNPRISADVGINHLFFTVNDIADYDSTLHTIPPLREESDRAELLAAVSAGVIDCISSAHTPLQSSEKCHPFPGAHPGISSIDTFVAQVLTLIHSDQISANAAIDAISRRPDAILHHRTVQSLNAGKKVDITVIDPRQTNVWTNETILSAGKNNPVSGRQLHGRVEQMVAGGQRITVN